MRDDSQAVFNEGWGQHETAEYVHQVRRLDGSRLVTDASGWFHGTTGDEISKSVNANHTSGSSGACPSGADCGDVLDVHAYPGPWPRPRHRRRWYGEELWESMRWTHSAVKASVLGEFGGLQLDVEGHVHGRNGWGYGRTDARNCSAFTKELVALWQRIANMAGLSACVYTQLTDVESERNGLITYDRIRKCAGLSKHLQLEITAARSALSKR